MEEPINSVRLTRFVNHPDSIIVRIENRDDNDDGSETHADIEETQREIIETDAMLRQRPAVAPPRDRHLCDNPGSAVLGLVDRLAPRAPLPEELSRMSRGRLLLTQCVYVTTAFLLFLAVMAYSLAHLSNSDLALLAAETVNATLQKLMSGPPPLKLVDESDNDDPLPHSPPPPPTTTIPNDFE